MVYLLGFLIVLAFSFSAIWAIINIYNLLVRLVQNVKNGWAQIDVQLKRRHDLIPNLVETAKGYMGHERQTLEAVVKARQQAVDASGLKDKQQAENILTDTLKSLFAVVESYPNLKADKLFTELQEELSSTENRISIARESYNNQIAKLNTTIQMFPANIVAGKFGFASSEYLAIEGADRQTPSVKFQ